MKRQISRLNKREYDKILNDSTIYKKASNNLNSNTQNSGVFTFKLYTKLTTQATKSCFSALWRQRIQNKNVINIENVLFVQRYNAAFSWLGLLDFCDFAQRKSFLILRPISYISSITNFLHFTYP